MDSDYNIEVSFDVFNLSQSSECSADYVEVNRVRYCGSQKPENVALESSRSDMRVMFKLNGKAKYPGFKASYKTKS